MNSVKLSDFLFKHNDSREARALWELMKISAEYVVRVPSDEILFGDIEVDYDEVMAIEEKFAAKTPKAPYGTDIEYADPGFQSDKKKRYPLDSEKHIRAANSYIGQKRNAAKYTSEQLSHIRSKIVAAWKRVIDKSGPPSAQEK